MMLFFLRWILVVFLTFRLSRGSHPIYDQKIVLENQRKYDAYVACVAAREKHYAELGAHRPGAAFIALRDSSIYLKCFDCLSPAEESAVQEIWKPNDSFLGRTVRHLAKEVARILQDYKVTRDLAFSWEYMALDSATWLPVLNLAPPNSKAERAKRIIDSFVFRGKKVSIGDLFELELLHANHSKHTGFYRCVRHSRAGASTTNHMEILYFVDIVSSDDSVVSPANATSEDTPMPLESIDDYLEAVRFPTKWSICDSCVFENGEQRRRTECRIRPKKGVTAVQLGRSAVPATALFRAMPCDSSLVPLPLRKKLAQHVTLEEFRPCNATCEGTVLTGGTVLVTETEEGVEMLDELPPLEYALEEALPPLKTAVVRKSYMDVVGNMRILDCGQAALTHSPSWRRDYVNLTSKALLTNGTRVFVNAKGELVFRELSMEDTAFYSCFTQNSLIRTYNLFVREGINSEEYVSYIRICIRFLTGLLIATLIVRVVIKTSASSEKFRNMNVKK